MQQPTTVSRLGAWLMLWLRWPAWLAAVIFLAVYMAASMAVSAMVADLDAALRSGGPLVFLLVSLAQFVAWALLVLFLARKLGGDLPHTAWGRWIGLTVLYYLVGLVPPGLIQGVVVQLMPGQQDLIVPVTTGFSLFWSCAMLPLLVWLVAAAHSGREVNWRTIWTYLTGEGTALWGLFIAFQVASLLLNLGLNRLLGPVVETNGDLLNQQVVNALRTTAMILVYVVAYREIRASQSPPDRAFA